MSVVDNSLLLARRADTLTALIDQLRSSAETPPQASRIAALTPKTTNGVDGTGILLNQRLTSKNDQAYKDMAMIQEVTVAVDVQPATESRRCFA